MSFLKDKLEKNFLLDLMSYQGELLEFIKKYITCLSQNLWTLILFHLKWLQYSGDTYIHTYIHTLLDGMHIYDKHVCKHCRTRIQTYDRHACKRCTMTFIHASMYMYAYDNASGECYNVLSPFFELFKCHIPLEPEYNVLSPQQLRFCI